MNYCEKVWDEISAKHQEKQVVLELAKGNSSLYAVMDSRKINISRTVKRLLNTGLLEKANGAYSFTDPLLRYLGPGKNSETPNSDPMTLHLHSPCSKINLNFLSGKL